MKEKYLSDLEIVDMKPDYDGLEEQLSADEEQLLADILELEKGMKEKPTLMHDVLEAVKKGALDYLDSMTDTGETFDRMKDPEDVSRLNNIEIDKKNRPVSAAENENWQKRTMAEAKTNPIDRNAANSTQGMSTKGAKKFERYKEAYVQRTKSIKAISADGYTINTKDNQQNYESLSGLRGYRVGPVVPMPSVQEMQEKYSTLAKNGGVDNVSKFIRDENYAVFDQKLMEEFGFTNRSQAEKWRMQNHLTIHEGPDGMFLVPTDVHDATSHKGYCSKLADVLKGKEGAEQALKDFNKEETMNYLKHEVSNRGARAMKGIGLTVVKDIMKHTIVILCKETYAEFHSESKESFMARMKNILQKCWKSVRAKFTHIISNFWDNIKGTILAEFLTALNDFLFGTFKRLFKLVRQMWGSIKSAFKVICSKGVSWEEKVFEATKILSAGIVGILGFSLNELIEKGLTSIGFPFASFVAECLSGLFAGIMSAVVLAVFENIKCNYKTDSPQLQISLANARLIRTDAALISVSTLKTDMAMRNTYQFVGNALSHIVEKRSGIIEQQSTATKHHQDIQAEIEKQEKNNQNIKNLSDKYLIDYDF